MDDDGLDESGLSTLVVVLIAIGCVLLLITVVGAIVYFSRRNSKNQRDDGNATEFASFNNAEDPIYGATSFANVD